jgi:hypothetical protein
LSEDDPDWLKSLVSSLRYGRSAACSADLELTVSAAADGVPWARIWYMDAGLAALLGATVGAMGAGGAALLTGLWNTRVAKRQIAMQETNLHRQLRFDRLRECREPRSKAYSEFIAQIHQLLREFDEINGMPPTVLMSTVLVALKTEMRTLYGCGSRLAVEGPQSVAASANSVVRQANACYQQVRELVAAADTWTQDDDWDTDSSREASRLLARGLDNYIRNARTVSARSAVGLATMPAPNCLAASSRDCARSTAMMWLGL